MHTFQIATKKGIVHNHYTKNKCGLPFPLLTNINRVGPNVNRVGPNINRTYMECKQTDEDYINVRTAFEVSGLALLLLNVM